ncbi:MAG: DNA mismatch repair protein MutS, partial [Oscillospiraceae bacterium]|nr:DNA mismatch repair protein MutS [Oscillospiraceae bacterium]
KELESKILSAGERLQLLERELFDGVCKKLTENLLRVQSTAYAVAYLDVLCALGELARDSGFTRPSVDAGSEIRIENGRHPVVERVLRDELFVPNDTLLDCGSNLVNIVTDPNMSGKSTYMRQVALIVILAQMGSFVPAALAHIGVVDAVFTRVGASDDLFAGDSTFMVEMKEVAEILQDATDKSLVILDEIGRGTSTFDGMSIARAVLEYCADKKKLGAKTLFATHYHELTSMEDTLPGVKNFNIAVKTRGEDIVFLRKIIPGGADRSYGIEVAKLAGLPQEVVKRAKTVLNDLETEHGVSYAPTVTETDQVSFTAVAEAEAISALRRVQLDTLTPLEAMNLLYELKQKLN